MRRRGSLKLIFPKPRKICPSGNVVRMKTNLRAKLSSTIARARHKLSLTGTRCDRTAALVPFFSRVRLYIFKSKSNNSAATFTRAFLIYIDAIFSKSAPAKVNYRARHLRAVVCIGFDVKTDLWERYWIFIWMDFLGFTVDFLRKGARFVIRSGLESRSDYWLVSTCGIRWEYWFHGESLDRLC